ncbi:aspartate ammonia-lyase [Sulfuriferula plumbiphila]|uniref:Aspartate ammonia-lyase n=1 Tax=Sulfuriferula plumbiphila TaxID=171865 RepID=A0A512L435_9PROT|nr:aspartate ammonia-lyase [Sulfuriferula plumbiphila]BBP05481.1 aspartate ammonia-lyase [Sulfuriferula plumbiphila]GEP29222.1 aspartate ammonia-lyase [Sulfuriferula plumbiphila]
MTDYRIEQDSLGKFKVPARAWYGIQTARAVENFPISGRMPDTDFIRAHVQIKLAAARANCQPDWLTVTQRDAIVAACERILAGELLDQFVVDRFQAGAGTSHNMNSNEVIANLANVALGGEKGLYAPIHPNDHVNMGQSTNDTIPTAIRLALLAKLPRLLAASESMAAAFEQIAEREHDTVKSGRTHLQDAVPTTIGREFAAYAWTLRRAAANLGAVRPLLCQTGLGGSAAGTGLNTSPDYARRVAAELATLTGETIGVGDLAAQMQSMFDMQTLSAALRGLALELTRIANDLRLLASGPRTGLGEITLPPVQPGSSIMPGKVNPVMFEMLNQVCYQVLGQDAAVAYMTQAGQLELNVMMPALGSALFDAMDWLTNAINAATEKNLKGLVVNRERCARFIHDSVALATLLNTRIGYMKAAEIAKESEQTGKPVREIVTARNLMSEAEFNALVLAAANGVGSAGGGG